MNVVVVLVAAKLNVVVDVVMNVAVVVVDFAVVVSVTVTVGVVGGERSRECLTRE